MSWTKKWALRAVAHCGQGCLQGGGRNNPAPILFLMLKSLKNFFKGDNLTMNPQEEGSLKIKAYRIFESSNPHPQKLAEIIKWEKERMKFVEDYVRNALFGNKKVS